MGSRSSCRASSGRTGSSRRSTRSSSPSTSASARSAAGWPTPDSGRTASGSSPVGRASAITSLIAPLRPIWPTAAILLVAVGAAWSGKSLHSSIDGLRTLGPYALLVAAAAVSMWFNRERAFVLSISLLAAFAARHLLPGPLTSLAAATLVPVNALIALVLPERSARLARSWRWHALIALEAALVFVAQKNLDFEGLDEHLLLRSQP